MENTSGTSPFIDHFILDPLELIKTEQNSCAIRCDEPFRVVSTDDRTRHDKPPVVNMRINPSFKNYCHLTMLMPESLKVIVGEYTFARSSHLKIGVSARDGVDVFVGCNNNGGLVAAKQCTRRASLPLPQILGPVNKSNLVRLLEMSTVDQRSFVMIMELCDSNLKVFIASDKFKEGGFPLKKRMCIEFLSGLNVLHANNLIHGNLKPENVLIGTDGILKIGDYPVVSNWVEFISQLPCINPERLCWEASEVKKRQSNHSAHKSDLQVGGMLLHYIICGGLHPFGPLTSPITVDSNIRAGQHSMESADKEAEHLLSWMLPAEANARKDTNICMTHPFFWGKKKQVQFLAAVGRQPEIRSGFRSGVLEQVNSVDQWLKMADWRQEIDPQVLEIMESLSADNHYDRSVAQLLKIISDIYNHSNESEQLVEIVDDVYDYIADRFAHCILPIYDIVIKSALCLRPQLEQVIHMTSKSPNTF